MKRRIITRSSTVIKSPSPRILVPALWKHQKITKRKLKKNNRFLDLSDPGTGKTRVALEVYAERRRLSGGKCLLLAPKTLLDSVWGDEIMSYTPDMTFICAYASNREIAFKIDVDIYITNIDAVKWLAEQPSKFFRHFDTLIIDEISYYKHATSARSRAVAKVCKYFEFREGLTGTPNANSLTELWHQVYIMDDGKRLGKSFYQFRNSVTIKKQTGPMPYMVKYIDREGADIAVTNLIKDISVRHDFEECMDIPPHRTRHIKFRMSPKHMKVYREFEDNAMIVLGEDAVIATTAAAVRTKLLQIASGAVYSLGGVSIIDTARNELIIDLVQERKHSLVFFIWTHQKNQLTKLAKEKGIKYEVIDGSVSSIRRKEINKDYQKGCFQVLFLHPKTGAHGLTLTRGTASIWGSPIYEADLLKQGTHRVWRGTQTRRTETLMVEAVGTVERLVYELRNYKTKRMQSLLDMIRESRESEYE